MIGKRPKANWRIEVKKMNEKNKTPSRLISIYEYDDLSVDEMKKKIEKIITEGLEKEKTKSIKKTKE